MKTALNNVVLPTLFNVVNNIVQHCWAWISLRSGVTMLNNIVDNIEQCRQHNIVQGCFHQAWTGCAFLRVYYTICKEICLRESTNFYFCAFWAIEEMNKCVPISMYFDSMGRCPSYYFLVRQFRGDHCSCFVALNEINIRSTNTVYSSSSSSRPVVYPDDPLRIPPRRPQGSRGR